MEENREKEDVTFMKAALAEAQLAFQEDEIPVGAVVVCKGRIIARAHNLTERYDGCNGSCRDAGDNGCGECSGWKILDGLYVVRHGRALHYVCRCFGLVADKAHSIWNR